MAPLASLCLASLGALAADAPSDVLRVCADPNNLPQSNSRGEGYENRIAEALAKDLGRRVEYTWFPQRMGFVRNTLRQRDPSSGQFRCDVIIGVPKGYELTATTQPYMRSTYALLFASREDLRDVREAEDLLKLPKETQRALRYAVFAPSPGADWLLRNGLLDRAEVYPAQSGDPAENPETVIERDLAAGKIDVAILWGPVAGHLTMRRKGTPAWRAAPFRPDQTIKFDYEISMGVRFGEKEWKATLDEWIQRHQTQVNEILADYRVPLLEANGELSAGWAPPDERSRKSAEPKTIPLRGDGFAQSGARINR